MKSSNKNKEESILLGCIVRIYDQKRFAWKLKLNVIRILLLLSIFSIISLLFIISTVYFYFKYVKGVNDITFIDATTAPISISDFRKKIGEYNIKEAKNLIQQKRISEALRCLTAGVSRSPDNLEARLILARIHSVGLKNNEYASTLLEAKLPLAIKKKHQTYIAVSFWLFSLQKNYEKKSILLLKKAIDEKIISDDIAIKILSKVFETKAINPTNCKEYFQKIIDIVKDNQRIKTFAIRCVSISTIRLNETKYAKKLLKENNIYSGEIFNNVMLADLINDNKEIEALKFAHKLLKTTKVPSSIYKSIKKIHQNFGNEKEASNCERMAILTTQDLFIVETFMAIEKNNFNYIEEKLSMHKKHFTFFIIKSAVQLKNEPVLNLVLKVVQNKNSNPDIDVLFSLCEAYLKIGNTTQAEHLLNNIKSINKKIENENNIAILQMAITAKNKNVTQQHIDEFCKNTTNENTLKLAIILKDNAYYAEAISILDLAKTKEIDVNLINKLKFETYAEQGNFCEIARLLPSARNVCPPKILVSKIFSNPNSDKFIMLSENEIDELKKEVENAHYKMKQYKAMFNF